MINTSEEFLHEIKKAQRNEMRINGYFQRSDSSVVPFSDVNIATGTLKISKKSVSKGYFNIGEAYIDMAEITLNLDATHQWDNLVNSVMVLSFSIYDNLSNELVCALGKWDVLSDGITRKVSSVSFVGDSLLNRLDLKIESQTFGTPFELVSYACEQCNVPFRMVEDDFLQFQNGKYVYYASDLTKVVTYRDLVMWVSQILVGYVTIDEDGYLVVRSYVDRESFTPNPNTIQSSEVGDYEYNLTGLQMTLDGVLYNSGLIGQGNYIELDSNPLLLSGTPDLKQVIINNVFSALSSMTFKSFKISYNGNPSLECGDTLVISDRHLSCPIQQLDWVYRGKSTIYGYLPDTASDVSSQRVKNASTSSGTAGSKLTVSRYRNSSELEIGQMFQQVASISFSTPEVATPMMLFTMRTAVSEQCDVTFRITYDNVVQDLDPVYTVLEGYFTFDFTNALNEAVAGSDHVLIIEALCSNGNLVVNINDCILSIYGYGVIGENGNFNGYVNISEVFGWIDSVNGKPLIG